MPLLNTFSAAGVCEPTARELSKASITISMNNLLYFSPPLRGFDLWT